jgi:hypothetical protein
MKADALVLATEPPWKLTLGPKSFSARWKDRPTGPLQIGLRVASAEERLLVGVEATARADLLLPGRHPEDPRWKATYDVCWIHYLLGHVLTSPRDANAPLWATQDGTLMLCEKEPHEPGDSAVVSARFTDTGLARLWDEYEALELRLSEVWPEISAEDAKKLGVRLVDGSFFEGLDSAAKSGNAVAGQAAQQLRRLLSHVVDIRTHGPRGAP